MVWNLCYAVKRPFNTFYLHLHLKYVIRPNCLDVFFLGNIFCEIGSEISCIWIWREKCPNIFHVLNFRLSHLHTHNLKFRRQDEKHEEMKAQKNRFRCFCIPNIFRMNSGFRRYINRICNMQNMYNVDMRITLNVWQNQLSPTTYYVRHQHTNLIRTLMQLCDSINWQKTSNLPYATVETIETQPNKLFKCSKISNVLVENDLIKKIQQQTNRHIKAYWAKRILVFPKINAKVSIAGRAQGIQNSK